MIFGKSLGKSLAKSLAKSFAGGDKKKYTVTFSCQHGSVAATVDGMGIQSGDKVEVGKTVVFIITPDQGYIYTGENPESVVVNDAITKSYVCVAVHAVTFSCQHGTVIATVDGVEIQSGAQVEHGKAVVFTIYPSAHYHYHYTNPETVLVDADVTRNYVCDIDVFFVDFSCTNGSVGATVDGIGIQSGGFVDYGKTVIFTITPDAGYEYTGENPESVVVHDNVERNYECTQVVNYLCFTSSGTNTVYIYEGTFMTEDDAEYVSSTANISHNCEYSTDEGTTWSTMPTDRTSAVSFSGTVYVRGNNPEGWGSSSRAPSFRFDGTGSVAVAGNVFSLLDNGAGTITTMPSGSCIPNLFGNNRNWSGLDNHQIVDASGLILPDASQQFSYAYLFKGCTGLVTAPSTLPSQALNQYCYWGMLEGCTSLVTAPEFLATTLVDYCYAKVLYGCSKLTGPVIIRSVTALGVRHADGMFTGTGTARPSTPTDYNKIKVAGNPETWDQNRAGIDPSYWTVELIQSDEVADYDE